MHVCDSKCSWKQTNDSLTALGFPVQVIEKVVGSNVIIVQGDPFEVARHKAWSARRINLCTRTERAAI